MQGSNLGQRPPLRHRSRHHACHRPRRRVFLRFDRSGRHLPHRAGRRPQRLQHVFCPAHQHRAIPDQHVAPRRPRVEGMAGHRQHLAPQIQRIPRRDQRSRPRRRLHHHNRPRQPRDDPVAQREMPRLRDQAHRLFRQQATTFGDPCGQAGMFLGIDHIHPARHHRHRSRGQRRAMRLGVDPARQAGNNHLPRSPQRSRQPPRHPHAQGRGIARPHHRHHRPRQPGRIAPQPQQRRRIRHLHQPRRIVRPARHQHPCPRPPGLRHLMPRHLCRAGNIALYPGSARHLGQGRQRGRRRSMLCHQPVIGHRPHPPRPDQPQPIHRIVILEIPHLANLLPPCPASLAPIP